MNAIPLHTDDPDVQRLVSVLNEERRLSAAQLMPRGGIVTGDVRSSFSGFVRFLNLINRARKQLERMGFTICRSGGTVHDEYWIGKHG